MLRGFLPADAPVKLGAAVAAGNFHREPGQELHPFQTLGQNPQVVDDFRAGCVIDALAHRGFGKNQLLDEKFRVSRMRQF